MQRKADFPSHWATRASADEIAGEQALRAELVAAAGQTMGLSVACTNPPPGAAGEWMQEWVVADTGGDVLSCGHGRFFGSHHTLTIAIGAAVKEARERAVSAAMRAVADGTEATFSPRVPRLTVRTHDRGFGPANFVGTERDNGRGGKTRKVAERALKAGVLLTIEWVPDGEPLPADSVSNAWSVFDADARKALRDDRQRELADRVRRGELPF